MLIYEVPTIGAAMIKYVNLGQLYASLHAGILMLERFYSYLMNIQFKHHYTKIRVPGNVSAAKE